MPELYKRVITSLFLLFLLYLSFKYNSFLIFSLIFIFFQVFFEANNIVKKIFKKNNLIMYILLNIINIYLLFFTLIIWLTLNSNIEDYNIYLLLILSSCILSDIGGFVFGKIFKGKKLTAISPNKTYSGMFGSYLFSIIFNFIFFSKYFTNLELIFFSLIISSLSQIGDLLISYCKRKANLKDTGNLLPGHGGILDRLDGLMLALPLGFIIMKIL